MATNRLTPKQEAFAVGVVELGNQAEAYRRAYNAANMTPQRIYEEASKTRSLPKVAQRIEALQATAAERAIVTREMVIRELAVIAFGAVDEVAPWDEQGPRLIPSEQLTRDQRALVESIKVKRRREMVGQGKNAEPWEIEEMQVTPHSKIKALELLGKSLGMFTEKVEHSGELGIIREYVGVDVEGV